MLISLDPGMNSPGVALWFNNQLHAAGRVSIPGDLAREEAGQRWFYVARYISRWVQDHTHAHTEKVDLVFEKPQWYQRTKSKGDPNDLVGVAGVAANVTGLLRPDKILSPEPAVWIGQVAKVCPDCNGRKTAPRTDGKKGRGEPRFCPSCGNSPWGTPRGRRIWSRLSDAERALCPAQNDAIDAVGVGLWALGRLEKVSVFSNGRDGR